MTVDFIGFGKMDDQIAIKEAATAGLQSLEHLILQLSHHQSQSQSQMHRQPLDCREIADHTVSKFKKMISILDRTGHARFRRGPTAPPAPAPQDLPPPPPPLPPPKSITLDFTKPDSALDFTKESSSISPTISLSSGSSITGDGSVSNGRHGPSVLLPPVAPVSAGKPPLSSSYKKRCLGHSDAAAADGGRCHCPKRRKSRVKRAIRVPAVGGKVADVPADEHSWRKYGQKPIKGSPYPRGYYKCSSVRGCPAKKHVERAPDDPSMLIITYEGEHTHAHHPLLSDTIIIHAS